MSGPLSPSRPPFRRGLLEALRIPAFPADPALAQACPVAEAAAPEDVAAEVVHRPVLDGGFQVAECQVKAGVRLLTVAMGVRSAGFRFPVFSREGVAASARCTRCQATSAFMTALCTAGRTCLMVSLAPVGCTRFVSNTT